MGDLDMCGSRDGGQEILNGKGDSKERDLRRRSPVIFEPEPPSGAAS